MPNSYFDMILTCCQTQINQSRAVFSLHRLQARKWRSLFLFKQGIILKLHSLVRVENNSRLGCSIPLSTKYPHFLCWKDRNYISHNSVNSNNMLLGVCLWQILNIICPLKKKNLSHRMMTSPHRHDITIKNHPWRLNWLSWGLPVSKWICAFNEQPMMNKTVALWIGSADSSVREECSVTIKFPPNWPKWHNCSSSSVACVKNRYQTSMWKMFIFMLFSFRMHPCES